MKSSRYLEIKHGTSSNYFNVTVKMFDIYIKCLPLYGLHKDSTNSTEVLVLLANFMDNYFRDALSFPTDNTLKIFHRGLRKMYLPKQYKNIFRNIYSVSHNDRDMEIFFFFLVDYISYNNYWEKKNENKDLGYFLSLHKLLQFYWFVLLLPALFGGKKSHIFLVSLSILPFNLSFSRAVIIRCWVTFCLRQIHKFVQFCFRAEVECNHMCHQKKIK